MKLTKSGLLTAVCLLVGNNCSALAQGYQPGQFGPVGDFGPGPFVHAPQSTVQEPGAAAQTPSEQPESAPPQYSPENVPPRYYFQSNVPPASGGGYTGYGGGAGYYNPDYRYEPANGYYQQQPPWENYRSEPYAVRPRFAYAPAGLVIPVTLATSISTQVAHDGDYVQANISQNVPLQGLSYIPAGSSLSGSVTDAEHGRFFNRSGALSMTFNQLRLPDGRSVPIQAHILGDIGKYAQKNGEVHGEGWGTKLGGFVLRSAIGAAGGAVFGTAVGAIASRGAYVGTGAWAGTAIGGGLGAVEDLTLRRGRNVLLRAGTPMQIQLDDPIQIPVEAPTNAGGQV